tara:strand:- start:83589 stop:83780 length:192 start_codon:yes stop_codon:yes gene_type:complete
MHPANILLEPGHFVRHPKAPELGLGRVQTIVGDKITVNFENAGKLIVDGAVIELMAADPNTRD